MSIKPIKLQVLLTDNTQDIEGHIFTPDTVLEYVEKVPVTLNVGGGINDVIGWCTLERMETVVIAVVTFLDNDIPHTIVDHTPIVIGQLDRREDLTVNKINLQAISFIYGSNQDYRIKSIREQLTSDELSHFVNSLPEDVRVGAFNYEELKNTPVAKPEKI